MAVESLQGGDGCLVCSLDSSKDRWPGLDHIQQCQGANGARGRVVLILPLRLNSCTQWPTDIWGGFGLLG